MHYPSTVLSLRFGSGVFMRVLGRGLSMLFLGLAMLGLGCKNVAVAPTGLSYSSNPAVYTVGTAIPANTPTHSGGDIDSYSVSPALPSGLNLDPKSGIISGTPTAATAAANYTVTATNTAGNATASLSITVNSAAGSIAITTQPADQTVAAGLTATFTVAATGTGTLSYQWQKNGSVISGATTASYTTPTLSMSDSGSNFLVMVTDAFGGSVTSRTARLTIITAPGLFTTTGSLVGGRTGHTATLLNDGTVLIAGGSDLSASLQTAELYSPSTGTFQSTGSMVSQRQKHTATLLADGTVLLVGGIITASTTTTLNTAEVYDPKAKTFTATNGVLASARSEHTATLLNDGSGKVLIVSGRNGTSYIPTAELYDPKTGLLSTISSAPAARATHTATLLNTGKVLLAGGFRSGNLVTAELYDPATGVFTATGNLTTPRALHTATLLSNGKVLLVGGAQTSKAEWFDPSSGTFTEITAPLVTARYIGHTATLLPSGLVLIGGGLGIGTSPSILDVVELFDPTNTTVPFTAANGTMKTPREHHSATLLNSGEVLVCAGDKSTLLTSAELYY